jgi:hypothetical protein
MTTRGGLHIPTGPVHLPGHAMKQTYDYVFNSIWTKIQELHYQHAGHPMFLPRQKGRLSAPLLSWKEKAQLIAKKTEAFMGSWIPAGAC